MPEQRAVIFDVDGVLVDSSEAHFESWSALAHETNTQFDRATFTRTFGMTSKDIIHACWPSNIVREHGVASLDARKEAIYRDIIADNVPIMPGARALIDDLHRAGMLLAVGSSGPPENVALVLRSLERESHFAARITGHDVTRGKPDPQVFLLACERLNVSPAHCAVIEDAPAGVDAAHAAGMLAIGLVSTGRTIQDLAHADLVVASLRDLSAGVIAKLMAQR